MHAKKLLAVQSRKETATEKERVTALKCYSWYTAVPNYITQGNPDFSLQGVELDDL